MAPCSLDSLHSHPTFRVVRLHLRSSSSLPIPARHFPSRPNASVRTHAATASDLVDGVTDLPSLWSNSMLTSILVCYRLSRRSELILPRDGSTLWSKHPLLNPCPPRSIGYLFSFSLCIVSTACSGTDRMIGQTTLFEKVMPMHVQMLCLNSPRV
ncbi:hypothetical protein BDW68DRAFT_142562 [Aspergillus falconensis]